METEKSKKPTAARWGKWLALLLLVLGAGVYANDLDGPFVFDDEWAIVQNDSIRSVWPPWRVFQAPPSSARGRLTRGLTAALYPLCWCGCVHRAGPD